MTVSAMPDDQALTVKILRAGIVALGVSAYVTDDVPSDWRPGSTPHLTVASDGAARTIKRAASWPTVRVVARAAKKDDPHGYGECFELARFAQGILLAHPGGGGVASYAPLLGPLRAPAPETGHPMAWFTVRAAVRAERIDLAP